jgi:SAM-dependent methyltransferase
VPGLAPSMALRPYHARVQGDDYRKSSLETWGAMAPGWERWRADIEDTATPVREWLLAEAAPRPGDTVLELAAGPGGTGFAAATIVGDEGRLLSTDFAPEMVEVARRRSAALGLRNVEHSVMDAERLELEDDSVDGVICQFGYMLMADPAAALAETRRVLRRGGRVALAVWCAAEHNPWIAIVGSMLVERGHLPPGTPGGPGIFNMASEGRTRALLEGAGFTIGRIEEVSVRFVYRDLDEYMHRARDTGTVFGLVYRQASEEERAALRYEIAQAFAPFAVDGAYVLPGVARVVVAS